MQYENIWNLKSTWWLYNDDKVDWKIAKTITKIWFTQQDIWPYIALVTSEFWCTYEVEALSGTRQAGILGTFKSEGLKTCRFFYSNYIRDNFFTLILIYILPAVCIDSLDDLKDFYGIRSFFNKVKVLEISLQRFHITLHIKGDVKSYIISIALIAQLVEQ